MSCVGTNEDDILEAYCQAIKERDDARRIARAYRTQLLKMHVGIDADYEADDLPDWLVKS